EQGADYYTQKLNSKLKKIDKSHYKYEATLKPTSLVSLSIFDLERKYRFVEHNVGDLILLLRELEKRTGTPEKEFRNIVTDRLEDIFETFN
ncbi:MAG: hypothetical protein AAGJ58_21615, partial [Pseudomonadota bacterium]